MAEKPATKKRSPAKQEMLSALADVQQAVQERREIAAKPQEQIEERALAKAVEAADALFAEGGIKGISELRGSIGKILSQLSDQLEGEVEKYGQIKKAIEAKEKELVEIFEIQKSASTLAALIEAQQRKREEFEAQMGRQTD